MIVERFVRKQPIAAGLRLTLERLFAADEIDALFDRPRVRGYSGKILFAAVVPAMRAVVSRKVDSARGRQFVAATGGLRAPPLLGCRLRLLDGNHLAATEHLLAAPRNVAAGPLPGLALVDFDAAAPMTRDVILCEDGHASERSPSAEILALIGAGNCWIANRNFCTAEILFGLRHRRAAFVIRQHGDMEGEAVGPRHARGRCEKGEVFEQALELPDDVGTLGARLSESLGEALGRLCGGCARLR